MLGSIAFVACVAAGITVAGILFVLFGPVPVRRKVTMVSRIQPQMPLAAMPVLFEYQPAPAAPVVAEPSAPVASPPPTPPARKRAHAVDAPIAPLQLRRPREKPAPLDRARAARGTESPRVFEDERTGKIARPEPIDVFDTEDMTIDEARRY